MEKSLQTAKIEELLKIYKMYKKSLKGLELSENEADIVFAELSWIGTIIKDLKWLLDDSKY